MTILLTIVHVLVCVFLVIVVLLQSGKAADLGWRVWRDGFTDGVWPPRRGHGTFEGDDDCSGPVHGDIADFVDHRDTECGHGDLGSRPCGEAGDDAAEGGSRAGSGGQAPAAQTPAAPVQVPPGAPQPTVEFLNQKGDVVRKEPLDLSKMPQVDPNAAKQPAAPAQPAPAQKK